MQTTRLSDLAGKKLDKLLDYLEEEWSLKIADNFEKLFSERLSHISKYAKSCIRSKQLFNLHFCVVTNKPHFYTGIKDDEIEVITIFDNRSSFKSITKEIRKYYGRI